MRDDSVNLDDLTRDPDDGAYHCPRCEAPFTRRSNLRRHFMIHTRSTPFKCAACGEQFSRSDELHYHVLLCGDNTWNDPSKALFPAISTLHESPLDPIAIYKDQSTASSAGTLNLLPQESSSSTVLTEHIDTDQAFADFLSSFTIPPVPTTPVFETSYSQQGTFQRVDNSPTPPPSSTLRFPPTSRHRVHPRWGMQPYSGAAKRRKSKEKPIYTRRQVDDMLDAVSNCFAGTMEEVLKRAEAQEKPPVEKVAASARPAPTADNLNVELRKILNDTLPRLVSGLQGLLENRVATQ